MHKKIIGPLKNIHDNDLSFCVITVSSNILSEYKYLHFLMHAGTDWALLSNPIQLSTQEREFYDNRRQCTRKLHNTNSTNKMR